VTIWVEIEWLYNIFNVPPGCELKFSGEDVWVVNESTGKGLFRLGYCAGFTFWRENPIPRALWIHSKKGASEGVVSPGYEPQYDMVIDFDVNGVIKFISDNRTYQEAEYRMNPKDGNTDDP